MKFAKERRQKNALERRKKDLQRYTEALESYNVYVFPYSFFKDRLAFEKHCGDKIKKAQTCIDNLELKLEATLNQN